MAQTLTISHSDLQQDGSLFIYSHVMPKLSASVNASFTKPVHCLDIFPT